MEEIFLIDSDMINKYQNGGLTYQPLIQSIVTPAKKSEETINDFLGPMKEDLPFEVEPVKIWNQPINFNWNIQYEEPDNYVGERALPTGKVYKTSEKENFKADLLNAYTAELQKRGFDEQDSVAYAKRIVAQDALESRYGQSGLSKYYNFGGVKDFRQNSDSLKVDTKEFENGKIRVKKQPFRKFKNLEEYVNYKLDLLGNSNFDVFSYAPEMMYARLVSSKKKYATDPNYERKLNGIYYLLWGR